MKIVHVMNWYIPKMGYQENFLPAEQKKLGYDVEIITSDRFPPFKGYKQHVGKISGDRIIGTGIYEENGVKIHRLPIHFEIENGGQILLKGLNETLQQLKPDIIHAHGPFSFSTIQSVLYSKKLCGGVFIDDHSDKNNFQINSIKSLHKKGYVIFTLLFYRIYSNRIFKWMPITYGSEHILKSIFNIPAKNIELLPLGADTNRFTKSNELRKIGRNSNNINDNEILIISTGKFDGKDIHILINSFKDIFQAHLNIKLLLVGDGSQEYMNCIKNLVLSTGIETKVIFKDFAPNSELPMYYNSADIGVWPGNPSVTVIEAIASGLSVIVPKGDLVYDILFRNNAAEGFERGNVESLSNALLKLIQNQKLRSELSDNSVTLATEILSWKKIAEKSIQIYQNNTCE